MPREWQGIRTDTADTADDGALYVANASYFIGGELRRRPGMEGFATTASGKSLGEFWNVGTGRWVIFVTSAGAVVAEQAV